jgi:hypothetical protein
MKINYQKLLQSLEFPLSAESRMVRLQRKVMPPISNPARLRIEQNVEVNTLFKLNEFAVERELMATKWFAYRFMSPMAATHLFARLYSERAKLEVFINQDRDKKVQGINWEKYMQREGEFTMVWRARQRADFYCVPYDSYISHSFEFAARRKRRAAPRPSQLHPTGMSVEAWLSIFDKRCTDRRWTDLRRMAVPQYHQEHFKGLAPQIDYRAYVLETLSEPQFKTGSWLGILEAFCYQRNELSMSDFEGVIAADDLESYSAILEADLRHGRLEIATAKPLEQHDYWLSCFGLPGCRDVNQPICASCPLSPNCEKVAEAVAQRVEKQTGYRDPVDKATKMANNARQAKCRANKEGNALSLKAGA